MVFSVCLFASSFTFWRSEVALTKQRRGSMLGWLALTILLGGIFLVGQGTEYWKLFQTGVDLSTNLFSTTFFTLTGFHGLHVLLGLIALLIFLWLAWEGDFASDRRESAFKSVGYYWHFVDVVWVFVLLTVYILPTYSMTTAIHCRPGAGKTSYLRMARLALGKGEGGVLLGSNCVCSSQTPHLNPLLLCCQEERRPRPLD